MYVCMYVIAYQKQIEMSIYLIDNLLLIFGYFIYQLTQILVSSFDATHWL